MEDLTEDLQEEFAKAQEISDVISQPIGGDVFDDDDLMNELELEMEKDAEDALLQPSAAVAAPAAAAPAAAAPAALRSIGINLSCGTNLPRGAGRRHRGCC